MYKKEVLAEIEKLLSTNHAYDVLVIKNLNNDLKKIVVKRRKE